MIVAVLSGKGGVGKSMLTSGLSMLFSKTKKVIAVDCDVDAPNLHLWLGEDEKWDEVEKISVFEKPVIDKDLCVNCGKCVDICAFNALKLEKEGPVLNRFFCEGCGACEFICPVKAITLEEVMNAEIRVKKDVHGFPLVSAQLYPGESGSGKVVDQIRKKAESINHEIMILDAPAGIGCPVIAAVNGIDFAILITEPTPSGFSDIKRALTVVNHFKIPYGVVINKWDMNTDGSENIESWAKDRLLGKISYDKEIFRTIANLKPVMETNLPARYEIEQIYKKLNDVFFKQRL